jgi:hypothetical protein
MFADAIVGVSCCVVGVGLLSPSTCLVCFRVFLLLWGGSFFCCSGVRFCSLAWRVFTSAWGVFPLLGSPCFVFFLHF